MATMPLAVSLIDYLVLAGAIACSLFAGLYYAYRDRNRNSSYRYHRGEGKLKVLPVALSLIVTSQSSIFFLGAPAEAYVYGGLYWMNSITNVFVCLGMNYISIPLFYPLQITSVYEYLERRHRSKFLRQMATVLSTISLVLYTGIVLFGASIAFEPVTNIQYEISVVTMMFIAVAYTSLGGLKAVVATDVVQSVFMILGILVVIINGIVQVGGITNTVAVNKASGRLNLLNFDVNPLTRHTAWGFIIGGSSRSIGFCLRQPTVQRLNSTKSMRHAKTVSFIAMIGFIVLEIAVVIEGLVAYAYFSHKGCDPLAAGHISNPNQIMPYTVIDMFASVPGIAGLYLAAVCSASLSTVSSLLGSISAIISEDFVKMYCKTITDKKHTMVSKIIVPFAGLASTGVALLVGGVKGPITQIAVSILGAVGAPLLCIFCMSIFVKFCTKKGLLSGAVVGLVLASWLSSGYNFSPGRKRTPWLPLGPTERCYIDTSTRPFIAIANMTTPSNEYSHIDQTTSSAKYVTDYRKMTISLAESIVFENQTNPTNESSPLFSTPGSVTGSAAGPTLQGLDYLYSISYLYFSIIVFIVSMLTATVVSKFTQPATPELVPPELMVSCLCRPNCGYLNCQRKAEDIVKSENGIKAGENYLKQMDAKEAGYQVTLLSKNNSLQVDPSETELLHSKL